MHSDWINTKMLVCVRSDLSELLLRSSGHFCCFFLFPHLPLLFLRMMLVNLCDFNTFFFLVFFPLAPLFQADCGR